MKIIAVSDIVVDWIYSPRVRLRLSDADFAVGCGDLPLYYLEYIVSSLDIPLFHVLGNHSIPAPIGKQEDTYLPGTVSMHCKIVRYQGLTIAGVEGSLRYKNGPYQYSQMEMWLNTIKLVPAFLLNRIKYGRYIDIFISHAPPWGIHDQSDLAHQGIKAFRWLLTTFNPQVHIHGHVHVYRPDIETETRLGKTRVINAYGYSKIEI